MLCGATILTSRRLLLRPTSSSSTSSSHQLAPRIPHRKLKRRYCSMAAQNWDRNSYKSTLDALNSLQSNAAVIAAWKKQARAANTVAELHEEMVYCATALDINLDVLSPKCIHVAGTKGKGSTSAMTESIIRHHGFTTGLFTSPHLITVRERIKLNGIAISEEQFVQYFWQCWDKLQASRSERWPLMPGWFRYLTLLAYKIFQEENVACAIVEVGMGGRGDSTNILTFPAACGITLLDYDHTEVLGNTLTEIAGEKAGIFKEGVPAISVPQTQEALDTLAKHAGMVKCPLYLADNTLESLSQASSTPAIGGDDSLGLKAPFLKTNAVLGVALSEIWLSKWSPALSKSPLRPVVLASGVDATAVPHYPTHELSEGTVKGLQEYHWPGRAQIHDMLGQPVRLFMDGAHTTESIKACVDWFATHMRAPSVASHVLMFNCNKPRDPKVLLAPIAEAIAAGHLNIDILYFTMSQVSPQYRKDPSNDIAYSAHTKPTWQHEMAGMWAELVAKANGKGAPAAPAGDLSDWEDALRAEASSSAQKTPATTQNGRTIVWPQVKIVCNVNEGLDEINAWINGTEMGPTQVDVLVTGSLYLVGAMLEYLDYPTDK